VCDCVCMCVYIYTYIEVCVLLSVCLLCDIEYTTCVTRSSSIIGQCGVRLACEIIT
jgi:hypothetical protein